MQNIYINLLKNHNVYSLIILLFLNLFDGIVTYIGLKLEFYREMNLLVNSIYNYSSNLFLLIKLIIPTIILTLLSLNIKHNLSKLTKLFIYIANIVYVFICVYHIILLIELIQSK